MKVEGVMWENVVSLSNACKATHRQKLMTVGVKIDSTSALNPVCLLEL